jgi:hypothetical protein
MRWRLGTMGFGYAEWSGVFYPPGVKRRMACSLARATEADLQARATGTNGSLHDLYRHPRLCEPVSLYVRDGNRERILPRRQRRNANEAARKEVPPTVA